ncbi:carboxymuconolactone decarboxylase [Phaeosphaeriaceae sp. SRC1lsM3a]|nr:carboxymuconolactone decarboxylase [Stagonospora sp. SRC1lsM3a]
MSPSNPPNNSTAQFDTGLKTRKEVVGEHYVNGALAKGSSEFAYPMQKLVTEWCWGEIWNRPGLDRKQRSLLNIGMLIALKSWPEVGVHIRGAVNNGLTELEIRESILQSAVYCGVPAGLEAMKVASAVLDDMVAKGEHVRELVG